MIKMEPCDFARFVDKYRAEFIQRVTVVMPLADELLSLGMLHEETSSQISAARTSQEKMRELFTALHSGGDRVKSAFYCALRDNQPHLLQDLEEQRIGDLSIKSSALTGGPVIAPGHKHTSDLISVSLKHKEMICSEYAYVTEYNSLPGEHVLLTDRYTELLIIQRHREQSEREKEIRSRGEKFFSARDNEKYINITVEQFFCPDDHGHIPKAVVLQGNSGNGKSFTALKIMLEWASGKLYAENLDFIFHLKCKEMNQISGEKSLVEHLRYSQSLRPAQISQILQHSPERVLFLIDGFDELKLSQDNMSNLSLPTDVQTPASPESTLKALLSGHLLSESFLLVTTRSTATDTLSKLLRKQPQRFTEIMGFSERGVEEYFQRFFKDDQLLQTRAYEHVKANETLFTACFIPVICWIICTVFRERHKDGKNSVHGLETTTSIYVDFVSTLLDHHCQGLSQSVPSLLRSLGQLAERGMLEQQVLFNEKSVSETVSDPANIPFLCKFLFKRRIRQETMFSFMHLSFQEFFTALHCVLTSEEESQRAVTKLIEGTKLYRSSVIQFLFGLCNKEVSSSLMESHSVSVSPTVRALLEEWILQVITDKKKNIDRPIDLFFFHCLYELHEEDFVRETLESLETIKVSFGPLTMTDCRVLLYCLQCCSHIRSLNLQHCSLTPETLKFLQPAVCRSQELWLDLMDFSDDDVGLLISALGEDKKVKSLSLKNSFLSDQALQRVLNSLSRQTSVAELYLTVKTITTSTAVILMNHLCNNEITEEMSVEVNENSHEESLCSCLRASDAVSGIKVSVEEYSWRKGTSESSNPRSGTLIYGISVILPHSKITNVNWTNFLQIFHKIKDLTEICPGFDENLKAQLSFLMSEPDVTYVTLNVMDLTESWAARILPHLQVFPNLNHISVGCVGVEFDDLGISWSFNESQTDSDLRLFFTAQNFIHSDLQSLFRTSDSPTPLSLSEFRLTGPQSELLSINWKSFIQILKFKDKPITEIGEDFDEKMDALLSLLPSVSGLKTVEMKMNDLTVNLAVRILSLIQTCPGLHYIKVELYGSYDERLCSSLTVSNTNEDFTLSVVGHGGMDNLLLRSAQTKPSLSDVSLTCPYSEMSNINWTRFLEIFYRLKGLLEISPEFNEHVNALLFFLNSVPGLKFICVEVASLTESWVTRILSLIQTCPSLQRVSLKIYGFPSHGLLLEEGIRFLEDSQKRPDCALIVHGSLCTKLTDQCTGEGEGWFSPCNQRVKLLYHKNYFMLSSGDDTWSYELLTPSNDLSLLGMSFVCPDSEMSCNKWTRCLQIYSQLRTLTETCPEFNEKMDALLSLLNSVPRLERVTLYLFRLTESWAVRILSLIQTCPSLQDISLKAGFLLEEGIKSLQNSEKRPDCTLTVEGFRCSKPTDQCTEHDRLKPEDCDQKVKLRFRGESFTITGLDG